MKNESAFTSKLSLSLLLSFAILISSNSLVFAEIYYSHTNHQGSIAAITNENGEVVTRNSYYPYGNTLTEEGEQNLQERGYTGQRKDKEIDIYYYNARYYDPSLSSFLSADISINQRNRYAYASTNPIMFTDSTGYQPDEKSEGEVVTVSWFPEEWTSPGIPLPGAVVGAQATTIVPYDEVVPGRPVNTVELLAVAIILIVPAGVPVAVGCAIAPYACIAGGVKGLSLLSVVDTAVEAFECHQSRGYSSACAELLTPLDLPGSPATRERILDIGSGNSRNIRAPRSSTVTLDIIPNQGIDINANAFSLPFGKKQYNTVTSDYLPSNVFAGGERGTNDIVAEIDRVLKPGGRVSIRTANRLTHDNIGYIQPRNALWQNFTLLGYTLESEKKLGGELMRMPGSIFPVRFRQIELNFIKPY